MIIFLYGEDTFRSREKLKEFKEKFLRDVDPSGNSLMTVNGGETTMEKINEALTSSSLFVQKRMVIIENIFANKDKSIYDQVYEYLRAKEKEQENIIIFWDETSGEKKSTNKLFKYLSKSPNLKQNKKLVQNFKNLSNTEATAWVKKRVKNLGGKISNKASLTLTSFFGSDLWQLNNEVQKLVNFKLGQDKGLIKGAETAEITEKDVEDLSRGKVDENIFALTDAISNKNKALALKLFEQEFEAGVADTYLMHMIIRQFKILLQVRQSLDQGYTSRKIINELKLHPFVVQKSLNQVRAFSLEILKKIIKQLILIDKKIKTGQTDIKTGISLLIARF
jgi:DNA polymerase-3 subunit delta